MGGRGRILFQLIAPQPVVLLEMLLDNNQVIATQGPAGDLRDTAGFYFSLPRTPGTYNIRVRATDNQGCATTTTTQRSVVVS